MLDKATESSSV